MALDVLIVAPTYDPHAVAVQWAVEQLGGSCTMIDYGSTPLRSSMTFERGERFAMEAFATRTVTTDQPLATWLRRPLLAHLDDSISPYDVDCTRRSWEMMHASFSIMLSRTCAFVANDPQAIPLAVLKPVQLNVAIKAGLKIPETLISNDEREILTFMDRAAARELSTIVKPLTYMNWSVDDGDFITAATAIVTRRHVIEANVAGCPMIYQTMVDKSYEVRVLVCGATYLAVMINRLTGAAAVDWRMEQHMDKLGCRRIDIPEPVRKSIGMLMAGLGLITASLDFIVDDRGDWIFLESNQAGNFLWIEEVNPTVPALDMVARFLLSRDATFNYDFGAAVRLAGFEDEVGQSYRKRKDGSDPRGGTRAIAEPGHVTDAPARSQLTA